MNAAKGLRLLGESCEGAFVYADATVRPFKALEGSLADDIQTGDAGDSTKQVFFFDTALEIDLGSDRIDRFDAKDLLATTSRIEDANGDGIIGFL